jgi:hypothetical protein
MIMSVVGVASAVVAAVGELPKIMEGIEKVGNMLHTDRSVVVIVENFTKRRLSKVWDFHRRGTFAVTPSAIIAGRQANIFGSQSKAGSILTGTEGAVLYQLEDDGDEKLGLYIYWKSPAVGAKKCSAFLCTIVGESPVAGTPPLFLPYLDDALDLGDTLKVVATSGGGEQAEMRYTLLKDE